MVRGRFLAGLDELWRQGKLPGVEAAELSKVRRVLYGKTWVVHVQAPESRGPEEVIRYLGAYVTRVGISDRRLVSVDEQRVTFRTRGSATLTLSLLQFGRRFLLHVLPKGFRKVRYYGLWAPGNVGWRLERAMGLAREAPAEVPVAVGAVEQDDETEASVRVTVFCPSCGGPLLWVGQLGPRLRARARGPPSGGAR